MKYSIKEVSTRKELKNFVKFPNKLYKDNKFYRFYRKPFVDINKNPMGMKLYVCKTLKPILALRQAMHDYCGEWFDIYDVNGKITIN